MILSLVGLSKIQLWWGCTWKGVVPRLWLFFSFLWIPFSTKIKIMHYYEAGAGLGGCKIPLNTTDDLQFFTLLFLAERWPSILVPNKVNCSIKFRSYLRRTKLKTCNTWPRKKEKENVEKYNFLSLVGKIIL